MKKTILLLSFLSITASIFSQFEFAVVGVNKTSSGHVFVFKKYKPSCVLDYSDAIYAPRGKFLIIGDTSCNGLDKSFLTVYNDSLWLVEKIWFLGVPEIEEQLMVIKNKYPNVEQRVKLAVVEKRKIDKEDSLAMVAKAKNDKNKLDSLTKEVDKSLTSFRSKNYVLWNWSFSYANEYSSFVDVSIEVINPFKSKIKYIWFTLKAINPVGDIIRDGITGATFKTVKGVGPIDYGNRGSYEFESVFYSKVVETMRITQIKIQFFDGTVKTIANPKELSPDD